MRYRNEDAIDRAEISSPRNFLLVTSAAVGERTESERREDENDRARTNRAREMYLSFGCFECSRCVRECAYSEELLFAFKR